MTGTGNLFPGLIVPRSSKEQYRRRVQGVVLRLALRGGEVSPDDVHRVLECPKGVDPKNFGLAFYGLAKAGIIAPVQFAASTRACRHGGIYRTWRISDAKTARLYLKGLATTGDDYAG